MAQCEAAGIDSAKQFWHLDLTRTYIKIDGAKLKNLDFAMPHIEASVAEIPDESFRKPAKSSDPYTKIQRQIYFEDRVIGTGVPAWHAYNLRKLNTYPNMSPRAAEAIMRDYKKGVFHSSVTTKITQTLITGKLQRTARLKRHG